MDENADQIELGSGWSCSGEDWRSPSLTGVVINHSDLGSKGYVIKRSKGKGVFGFSVSRVE